MRRKRSPVARRYARLEGILVGDATELAVRVNVGGVWHWVPKSVVYSLARSAGEERDEIVLDEWFARQKGWA